MYIPQQSSLHRTLHKYQHNLYQIYSNIDGFMGWKLNFVAVLWLPSCALKLPEHIRISRLISTQQRKCSEWRIPNRKIYYYSPCTRWWSPRVNTERQQHTGIVKLLALGGNVNRYNSCLNNINCNIRNIIFFIVEYKLNFNKMVHEGTKQWKKENIDCGVKLMLISIYHVYMH